MEDNKQKYIDEARSLFNDLCLINGDTVVRLVGFHDGDDDYYYVGKDRSGHETYYTCLSWIESLNNKGLKYYQWMEDSFSKNGCPPEECFLMSSDNVPNLFDTIGIPREAYIERKHLDTKQK